MNYGRLLAIRSRDDLKQFPAVALLGPRQCGKTTLAKELVKEFPDAIYLDLELPSDLRKLDEPELYLPPLADRLVCLDEVQRAPQLFPVLRGLIDQDRRPGRFLLLGSASPDLLRQGNESLAGRLALNELPPLLWQEVNDRHRDDLWLRGGFPDSLLSPDALASCNWRRHFISSFLERDVPQLGFQVPAASLRRLWQMLAHLHGQQLNLSQIGQALGVSHTTVRSWLDILEGTYLIRLLSPWHGNSLKRLVKTPKVYLRDSGLLHCLLELETMEDLHGHPQYGASWEGWVIEQILAHLQAQGHRVEASYYRNHQGDEVDLVLRRGLKCVAIECKASAAPQVSKGFHQALGDVAPDHAFICAPVSSAYPIAAKISVSPLDEILQRLPELLALPRS